MTRALPVSRAAGSAAAFESRYFESSATIAETSGFMK